MQGRIQPRPPWMGLTAGASRVLFETGAAATAGHAAASPSRHRKPLALSQAVHAASSRSRHRSPITPPRPAAAKRYFFSSLSSFFLNCRVSSANRGVSPASS